MCVSGRPDPIKDCLFEIEQGAWSDPLLEIFRERGISIPDLLDSFPGPCSGLNSPAFKKLSTADKARVFDAIHTRTIIDQVHARLAFGDLAGAKRFLGHLGANFDAKLIK